MLADHRDADRRDWGRDHNNGSWNQGRDHNGWNATPTTAGTTTRTATTAVGTRPATTAEWNHNPNGGANGRNGGWNQAGNGGWHHNSRTAAGTTTATAALVRAPGPALAPVPRRPATAGTTMVVWNRGGSTGDRHTARPVARRPRPTPARRQLGRHAHCSGNTTPHTELHRRTDVQSPAPATAVAVRRRPQLRRPSLSFSFPLLCRSEARRLLVLPAPRRSAADRRDGDGISWPNGYW